VRKSLPFIGRRVARSVSRGLFTHFLRYQTKMNQNYESESTISLASFAQQLSRYDVGRLVGRGRVIFTETKSLCLLSAEILQSRASS
jgi:hypothetical protein